MDLLKAYKDMGLANDPDELVDGLSDFLMEVGFSSSFLDRKEVKARGLQLPLWQVVTRTLLNPLAIENKIFYDNLAPKIEDTLQY